MKKGSKRCADCEFFFAPEEQSWGVVWEGHWYCSGDCLASTQFRQQIDQEAA